MKLKLHSIPVEIMIRLKSAVHFAQESKCYLSSSKHEIPFPKLYIIIALLAYFIVLINSDLWTYRWTLVLSGVIVFYFASREFQKTLIWWTLGKDAIFFDSKYCMVIIKDELTVLPLYDYNYSDVILSDRQYKARFHFKNTLIILPCSSKEDKIYSHFQEMLNQYSHLSKASTTNFNFKQDIPDKLLNKLLVRKTAFIVSAFALISLWFVVPIIIDHNQYQSANIKNTATAYRTYLNESNNLRYRENARTEIRSLYNKYISQYMSESSGISGASAFKEVLEYLRDKNLFSVDIIFTPSSELQDIFSNRYEINPVTPSFSQEKSKMRQDTVINLIKSTLGSVFPLDIITVSDKSTVAELPRFEVSYTYKNNPESIYYPTEEGSVPAEKRTWYYGIIIDWYFTISIQTKPIPIYSFSLLSQPAVHFSSQTLNADDVYSSMASSAFNDFQNEFNNRFFKVK